MPKPSHPKIYHITHADNLPSIIGTRKLLSDARLSKSGGPKVMVGMSRIKLRRLTQIKLDECYPNDFVGEYVPFYFCPRSVMLYLIWKRNPELAYQGGQAPIVHLEADLYRVIEWAEQKDRKWAFSVSNASAYGVDFRNEVDKLDEINWSAVADNNWGNPYTKHWKQAEFLTYRSFPWSLVDLIGVYDKTIAQQAAQALVGADHNPPIEIKRDWYY